MLGVTKPYGDVTSITILNGNVTHIQKYYYETSCRSCGSSDAQSSKPSQLNNQKLRVTSQVLLNLMFFIKCITKPYCGVTHNQKYYLWDQLYVLCVFKCSIFEAFAVKKSFRKSWESIRWSRRPSFHSDGATCNDIKVLFVKKQKLCVEENEWQLQWN